MLKLYIIRVKDSCLIHLPVQLRNNVEDSNSSEARAAKGNAHELLERGAGLGQTCLRSLDEQIYKQHHTN